MSVDTKAAIVFKKSSDFLMPFAVMGKIKEALETYLNRNIFAERFDNHFAYRCALQKVEIDFSGDAHVRFLFKEDAARENSNRMLWCFFDCSCDHRDRLKKNEMAVSLSFGCHGESREIMTAVLDAFPENRRYFCYSDASGDYEPYGEKVAAKN